jgi:hypothetical protein
MVIAVSASRGGCRGGNLFPADGSRATALRRDHDQVRVSGPRVTLQVGMARNRAVNAAFYFTGWRCRFITATTGLSTIFSPGDTLRDDKLMKRPLFPPDRVLSSSKFPPGVIRFSRFP